ncbi:acyl carrier protein [Streptomyces sp. NPDC058155]|uniref:acyl carrier protein n=1 Tax=Streptomyces sp. NPDC058155 TaxID=3346359 RepID=UPI0036F06EC3
MFYWSITGEQKGLAAMWDKEFEKLIRQYLPFVSPDEELTPQSDLRDLGLDSLGMVELLAALENTYEVQFRDEALKLDSFRTPETLWKTVSKMLEPAAG